MKKIRFFIFLYLFLLFNIHSPTAQTTVAPSTVQLNILTWNIQMLPIIAAQKKQPKRARLIAELLENSEYDMILFQEMFHKRAIKILKKGLQKTYPYIVGPVNKKGWPKLTSGLMIFSKLPLTVLKEIKYSDCANVDCITRKGAVLVEAVKDDISFQIINTHLQANYPKKSHPEIIHTQCQHIQQSLLLPFQKEGVPQIVAGDLNTPKKQQKYYERLLETFEMEDGELQGGTHTFIADDFKDKKAPYEEVLDYVLYKQNGQQARIQRQVKYFRKEWKKGMDDLSDHYAIHAKIEFLIE